MAAPRALAISHEINRGRTLDQGAARAESRSRHLTGPISRLKLRAPVDGARRTGWHADGAIWRSAPTHRAGRAAGVATERIVRQSEKVDRTAALPRGQSASRSSEVSHRRSAFSGLSAYGATPWKSSVRCVARSA